MPVLDENDGLFELYQSSHSTVAESNARVARIAAEPDSIDETVFGPGPWGLQGRHA